MSEPKIRIPQLDGLRAMAIVGVFVHHAYHVPILWMGVDLFFVLSGFLITGILVNQKTKSFQEYISHFYARRARRILPPYLVLMLIVVVFFPGPWLRYWYMYLGATNFLMPLHLKTLGILSPLWSLAVEEQFYLIWPLVVYFLSPKWILRCSAGLILVAPALRYFCTPMFSSPWAVYMLLPFRVDTLAVGALTALTWPILRGKLQQSPRIRMIALVGTLGTFLGCGLLLLLAQHKGYTTFANSQLGNLGIYECTLGMMGSIFLLALMGFGKGLLSSWPFLWLGRISYSFYLIHLLFLTILPSFAGMLSLVCALSYAVASWFLMERPLLRSGRPEPALVTTATSISANS